jgi:hypothetical protein
MTYGELVRLYFDRSNALQWYWTIYVVVIGGLLAFSSLRRKPDLLTAILVTVLYAFFAYKNLGAIGDVTAQRQAIVQSIRDFHGVTSALDPAEVAHLRAAIEPTLISPAYEGIRNFHIASDLLTIAALWAMEWRRMRIRRAEETAVRQALAER